MRSTITTSPSGNLSVSVSHASSAVSVCTGTSRCDISSLPSTMFAQRTSCISASPRLAVGMCARSQNCPCRSGSAATEWLPVVIVITCPCPPCRSAFFSASSTDACSARLRHVVFSKTNVSSPMSYAWNLRGRPIARVDTTVRRRTPSRRRRAKRRWTFPLHAMLQHAL